MEEYFTTKEVAQLLKVKPTTIRRWIAHKLIPAIGIGETKKEYRIAKGDLDKFIAKRRTI